MSSLARRTLSVAALALSFSVLPAANAAVVTENFTYSGAGAPYGNTAQATGSITFDTTNIDATGTLLFGDISALSMTVTGATAGNGTYILTDFSDIYFTNSTGSPFDWTQPLIGQNGWGTAVGSFSFVAQPAGAAPNASNVFEMYTNGGFGDGMTLTQMTPGAAPAAPVPEPETYMLMGIASAALAYARRRNNKKQQGTAEVQPSGLLAA